MGKVSAELGNYKRIVTWTISIVNIGEDGPEGGVKIASDIETGKDIYAVTTLSWVPL